jgi:hypothetical protein
MALTRIYEDDIPRYRVASGGTILYRFKHGNSRSAITLRPDPEKTLIAGEDFPAHLVEELVGSGYLELVETTRKKRKPQAKNPPGVPDVPALPFEMDASKFIEKDGAPPISSIKDVKGESTARALVEAARTATREAEGGMKGIPPTVSFGKPKVLINKGKAPVSPWVLDPDGIKGKSLLELNTLVKERDSKGPEFTAESEAVTFLSKDYGK